MRRRILSAVRATFTSLRIRNFRLFFTGQLISQVGNWLTAIALVLLVLHRTGSGIAIGLLTAAQFGPVLVLGAWAGLVADRSNKRSLLIKTQTLEMLQSFALAGLAFWHGSPLWAFYAVALMGGLMLAFDNPTRRAFVSEMVPETQVRNAVSLNAALMTSSRVLGPTLAGVLSITVGFGWCFAIDGASYLAVLASLFMMRPGELRQPRAADRSRGQVREGLRYVRETPDLWIPLVMMAVIGALTFNFAVVLPLFVERTLGGTDASYTVLYSVLSVGSLLGALAAAQRRRVEVTTIAASALVFGVAMLLFAAAPGLSFAFPLALFVGFASVWFMTASTAMIQLRSDPRMRGRVLALQAIVLIGSTPVGGPLLGYVCDVAGARVGVAIGGLAAVGAATWGLRAMHDEGARPAKGRTADGPADLAPQTAGSAA